VQLFEQVKRGNLKLSNRIFRSATFEGMCDAEGFPTRQYEDLYQKLALSDIGGIITGFAYISKDGRAVHPGQAGLDSDEKIPCFQKVTDQVHKYNSKIFIQLAHCGRQTSSRITGQEIRGASSQKSPYFEGKPKQLTTREVDDVIANFAAAASRAQKAGFDGIQLHAAHGYLIHQFLHPAINKRIDIFGIEKKTGIGFKFLELTIKAVRESCGSDYPILIKISGGDDYRNSFSQVMFKKLILELDRVKPDAIEISYGTMDNALNIFRGSTIPVKAILKHNFRYKSNSKWSELIFRNLLLPFLKKSLKFFTPGYNLRYSKTAKKLTDIPILSVGGFRTGIEMRAAIENDEADFISLCRPLICEPDFMLRLKENPDYISKCINCNICAIMCDSSNPTICYLKGTDKI